MNNTIENLTNSSLFALPKCLSCKHLLEDQSESLICEAFPTGIPDTALWKTKDSKCNDALQFEEV